MSVCVFVTDIHGLRSGQPLWRVGRGVMAFYISSVDAWCNLGSNGALSGPDGGAQDTMDEPNRPGQCAQDLQGCLTVSKGHGYPLVLQYWEVVVGLVCGWEGRIHVTLWNRMLVSKSLCFFVFFSWMCVCLWFLHRYGLLWIWSFMHMRKLVSTNIWSIDVYVACPCVKKSNLCAHAQKALARIVKISTLLVY